GIRAGPSILNTACGGTSITIDSIAVIATFACVQTAISAPFGATGGTFQLGGFGAVAYFTLDTLGIRCERANGTGSTSTHPNISRKISCLTCDAGQSALGTGKSSWNTRRTSHSADFIR